jgi:hypothetical protein
VPDGVILTSCGHFSVATLSTPSPIESLASDCVSESEGLNSIVFENVSRLKQSDSKTFSKTGLKDIRIPASIDVLP